MGKKFSLGGGYVNMKRKGSAQSWSVPALSYVVVTFLGMIALLGTSGCSMTGVYPAAPTSAETLTTTGTPEAAAATEVSSQSPTKEPGSTAVLGPTTALLTGTVVASPTTAPLTGTAVLSPTTALPTPTTSPTSEPSATPTSTETPIAVPTPTETIVIPALPENVNPLTGFQVPDKTMLKRLPLFVRIGNDPQIRPQSGLSYADLVYEDIMDGWWITRLTGVFLSSDLEAVGPVRSARLVNLQMVPQYKGGLVHSGASDPIRWRLSKSTIVDLDEFFHRSPYFYKEGADWRGRLFVNLSSLRQYLKSKKLEKEISLEGFVFDTETSTPPAGQPVTELTIPYPKNSVVRFVYDPLSGQYLRFVQGQPHLDAINDQQLSAANVVVQFCPHNKTDIVEDSQGTTSIDIVLLGEGKALVFRDGVVIPGRWVAQNPDRMPHFLDDSGRLISFKPGQTWFELVPPDYEIDTIPVGPMGATIAVTNTVTSTVPALVDTPVATKDTEGYYYTDSITATQTVSEPVTKTTE